MLSHHLWQINTNWCGRIWGGPETAGIWQQCCKKEWFHRFYIGHKVTVFAPSCLCQVWRSGPGMAKKAGYVVLIISLEIWLAFARVPIKTIISFKIIISPNGKQKQMICFCPSCVLVHFSRWVENVLVIVLWYASQPVLFSQSEVLTHMKFVRLNGSVLKPSDLWASVIAETLTWQLFWKLYVINVKQCMKILLINFTYSYHFQSPWPCFKVTAGSNGFNGKFHILSNYVKSLT